MKSMLVLLMLNVAVLSVWTVIDPLHRRTVVLTQDPFLRHVETYGVCRSEHDSVFLLILCLINLGSLLFALFQAYMARNISTDFQESNYIFLAMAFILLVFFIGFPVMIIAHDNVAASFFLKAGVVFVVCSTILLLIFIPKVWAVKKCDNISASTAGWQDAVETADSPVAYGMNILNMPMAQAALENENRKLQHKICMLEQLLSKEKEGCDTQAELEKEIHELGPLMAKEKGGREQAQFYVDGKYAETKEISKEADMEVGSTSSQLEASNADKCIMSRSIGTGIWTE